MENQQSPSESPSGLELQEIIETLGSVRARPRPTDPRSGGCLAAIAAVIALLLLPIIGRGLGLSGGTAAGVGIGLGLVVLVGGFLGIFGGGFVSGAIIADVDEAIEELMTEWPDGDPEVIRRAAITILDGSTISTGPTSVEAFDAEEVAVRLGPALGYVLRIERFLLQRQEIYPVFTMLE